MVSSSVLEDVVIFDRPQVVESWLDATEPSATFSMSDAELILSSEENPLSNNSSFTSELMTSQSLR